jgi:OOP family OmpA-OmpF porin
MNRTIATTTLLLTFFTISAQEIITKQSKNNYNKWSVEVNIGNNKPIKPFSKGYSSSANNVFMKFPVLNHFDLGVRHMFSTKFGLKLDAGSDIIESQKGSDSKPFHSQQNIVSLQMVYNLGKDLGFEGFSNNRFGLLAHFGIQSSQLNGKTETGKKVTEYNGGIMYGLTPQFKLSDRFSVSLDFSFLTNTRQHLNWDGNYSIASGNLTGNINYFKLGLNYYLGKNEKHADWYTNKIPADIDPEIEKRLDALDSQLKDTDKDGIFDHLDVQNNTPEGVAVDSKGRIIDENKNGVPDELEFIANDSKDGVETFESDILKMLVKKGYVNVFYDVNRDEPNASSTNNIYYIIKILKSYPNTKVTLIGYTDITGNTASNLKLSQRRVENLKKVLISKSIDENRISIFAEGIDKDNKTSDNTSLQLARRVSIILE